MNIIKYLLIFFYFSTAAVSGAPLTEAPQPMVLPKISNQAPITLVAEKGFWTEYLKNNLISEFTRATGVQVIVKSVSLSDMYQLQTVSMQRGLGKYDVVTIEAGWAKEWAANGYTVPITELVKTYDAAHIEEFTTLSDNYYPALLNILSYNNELHSLPYNSYVMGNHYRKDLFDNPLEQQAFVKRFGYPLASPVTLEQLRDTAEFFTRKKGQRLAGKKLKKDFYGVALMSGNRPHINDELSSILWGLGGKWFFPEYEKSRIKGFHVRADSKQAKQAARYYVDLMQYAYPANVNFAFLEAATALKEGRVAMWPFAYNNLWSISGEVNNSVPGAKLGISNVAGGKPYQGAYSFAVSYDSKNPQAAYWLLKYLSSFESQLAYANGGGNPCRLDVIAHLKGRLTLESAQRQALQSSYLADQSWRESVAQYGHFSSTAMGSIYPELMKAAYRITQKPQDTDNILQHLKVQITTLQNLYGEEAMLAE